MQVVVRAICVWSIVQVPLPIRKVRELFNGSEGDSQRWASWEAGFVPDGVCAELAFDVRHSRDQRG